jgi:hypothetical protein
MYTSNRSIDTFLSLAGNSSNFFNKKGANYVNPMPHFHLNKSTVCENKLYLCGTVYFVFFILDARCSQ